MPDKNPYPARLAATQALMRRFAADLESIGEDLRKTRNRLTRLRESVRDFAKEMKEAEEAAEEEAADLADRANQEGDEGEEAANE